MGVQTIKKKWKSAASSRSRMGASPRPASPYDATAPVSPSRPDQNAGRRRPTQSHQVAANPTDGARTRTAGKEGAPRKGLPPPYTHDQKTNNVKTSTSKSNRKERENKQKVPRSTKMGVTVLRGSVRRGI